MEGNRNMKEENVLIIHVDDDSTSLLAQLMERLGCSFRVIENPKAALTHLENGGFTLIIADSALFQAKQMAQIQDLCQDRGLLFIGNSFEELKHKLNPGVSDFLSKPLTLEEVGFRLKRILLERDRRIRSQEVERELQEAGEELRRKGRELELSEEDLEGIKHLYKEIGDELTSTSEKLRRAKDQLENLAITDGLTEVYNHRHFMDRIHEGFEAAKKESIPISLLMVDIDHFKAFNDNHGHMTGDLVLRDVAQILKSNSRQADIVARYGGEEFAVILPETDSSQAEKVAESIRTAVESYRFSNGNEALRVTVSIGIGAKDGGIDSADQLISFADKSLYLAKSAGRNRFAFGKRIHPPPIDQWFSRF
jgi:diguanylate cyclase (GGDEF)-like protein